MHAKILKTKETLLMSLSEMIQIVPINEVTVTELCRRAGVNRTTFYKYYSIPGDIISEQFDNFVKEFLNQLIDNGNDNQIYPHMVKMCKILKENIWILNAYNSVSSELTLSIQNNLIKHKTHSLKTNAKEYFIAGGVSAIMTQWILQGCQETPEFVASLLTSYIENFASFASTL